MKGRRVKITGIGFVTPTGIGKDAFRQGILESRSHVSVVKRFPEEGGEFVAAEVKKFNIGEYNDDPAAKRLPRHTQFALAAARMALDDAGLAAGPQLSKLAPIVITGTSLMDSAVINKTIEDVTKKGPRFGLARVVFQGPVAAIPAAVAESVGGARTLSLQSACCGGSDAIGQAAQIVASGEADVAICGGTEAPIYYHPMLELRMAGLSPATSERPEQLCRPFDLWRTTGVIGEGSAIVVLEPEESPRPGYAFVRGYSFATDVPGQPGEGWRNAVEMALANARIDPSQVDSINAWGPGHKEIDAIEASVLRAVFGSRLDNIPATSIKGAIGNPFAAAGAIQVGCAALGMKESFIPPTVNWTHLDPACRLNLSNRARFVPSTLTLVNSHGVSGTNSCLLLERCT